MCVAIVLAVAPFGLPLFAMTLLTEALILGLLAMSLDLMVGYTRLISFGHAAAYGLGAYASGYLLLHTSLPLPFAVRPHLYCRVWWRSAWRGSARWRRAFRSRC